MELDQALMGRLQPAVQGEWINLAFQNLQKEKRQEYRRKSAQPKEMEVDPQVPQKRKPEDGQDESAEGLLLDESGQDQGIDSAQKDDSAQDQGIDSAPVEAEDAVNGMELASDPAH